MNTKRTIAIFLGLAMMATAFPPSTAISAEHDQKALKANFCTQFSTKSGNLKKRLADQQAKISKAKQERTTKLAQKQADRDDRLTTKRAQADERRAEQFAKLDGKAITEAQKAAIVAFQESIQTAIAARKAAVDAAMKTFRDGLAAFVTTHQTSVQNITTAYQAAVDAANAKAKNDCADGVAPATVRADFTATMKTAKDKMQTDRKALEKLGSQAESLAKTRNAAVQKAMDDFKAALGK